MKSRPGRTLGTRMKREIEADSQQEISEMECSAHAKSDSAIKVVLDGIARKKREKNEKKKREVFTGTSSLVSGSTLRRKVLLHPTKV